MELLFWYVIDVPSDIPLSFPLQCLSDFLLFFLPFFYPTIPLFIYSFHMFSHNCVTFTEDIGINIFSIQREYQWQIKETIAIKSSLVNLQAHWCYSWECGWAVYRSMGADSNASSCTTEKHESCTSRAALCELQTVSQVIGSPLTPIICYLYILGEGPCESW